METAPAENGDGETPAAAAAVQAGPQAISQDYGNLPMAVIRCIEEPALFSGESLRSALLEVRTYSDYCRELLRQLAGQPAEMYLTHDARALHEAQRNPSEECLLLDKLAGELRAFAALDPEQLANAEVRAIIYRTAIDAMRVTHPGFRPKRAGVTAPPRSPADQTPAGAPHTHPGT